MVMFTHPQERVIIITAMNSYPISGHKGPFATVHITWIPAPSTSLQKFGRQGIFDLIFSVRNFWPFAFSVQIAGIHNYNNILLRILHDSLYFLVEKT